mmetsp:Transcript_22595/g.31835  ORF Transcript_22595/g.31835 Transcript_22595/m.31835 type:complete len:422 (+) Transcript_22595:86-1351(+)
MSNEQKESAASASRVQKLRESLDVLATNSLVEVMEGLETLLVYAKNLILFPEEKKYRKVKKSNVHYQQRLGHLAGAESAMAAIGYLPNGEYLRLDEEKVRTEDNGILLRELEQVLTKQLTDVKKEFNDLPPRLPASHQYRAVAGASVHSEIGKRHNMEDDEVIIDSFCGDHQTAFFGLYDGHGGRATVDFVVKVLHMNLSQQLKLHPDKQFSELHARSYLATDGQLRRQNILRSGSTSVTCVVAKTANGGSVLHTANVGDSRAILIRNGKAVRLTIDHKASLPEEAKRIVDAGGFIGRNKRVNGVLAISRALGDHMLKENDVVSAVPHTSETVLTNADSHLILACDGVWDVLSDQEAADLVLRHIHMYSEERRKETGAALGPGEDLNEVLRKASHALAQEALDRRSLDNITAMVVQFNPYS